jgi:hypothetical protein
LGKLLGEFLPQLLGRHLRSSPDSPVKSISG